MKLSSIAEHLPMLAWARHYNRETFTADLVAAVIVTIMLIPQSLAYALLAGLPPEAGLYASIVPIVLYSMFGSSRVLAVGPVAVISLMTASSIGQVVEQGTADYATAALVLAGLSGGILLLMGVFRLGFLANFLSHPVIAGFISASGVLIAISQLKHVFGVSGSGHNVPELLHSLFQNIAAVNVITLVLAVVALCFLFWVRQGLKPLLLQFGMGDRLAGYLTKAGPVVAVAGTTIAVFLLGLDEKGVAVVGSVPQALPPFTMPLAPLETVKALLMPALLISIIGFVESISVAQTLAAKERQHIAPNQELVGLGMANIGAAFSGGFPVTGGFSRSVVNYDAGAKTPAAGAFTAVGLAIAAFALTPLVYFLPKATLAATIIVAVLSLVDFSILKRAWAYSKADFAAVAATMLLTLLVGVEVGVSTGVALSILLILYKTSRPHVAEVGLVPGTHHFRNIHRYSVLTDPSVVSMRVDESLYFANARYLKDYIDQRIQGDDTVKHIVLMCSAVNEIDMSALEALEAINQSLQERGIALHLSEVKGPVMDRLASTHLLKALSGTVFLAQFDAVQTLCPNLLEENLASA